MSGVPVPRHESVEPARFVRGQVSRQDSAAKVLAYDLDWPGLYAPGRSGTYRSVLEPTQLRYSG